LTENVEFETNLRGERQLEGIVKVKAEGKVQGPACINRRREGAHAEGTEQRRRRDCKDAQDWPGVRLQGVAGRREGDDMTTYTVYFKSTLSPEALDVLQGYGFTVSSLALALQSKLPASMSCKAVGNVLHLKCDAADESEALVARLDANAFFSKRIEAPDCRELLARLGAFKFDTLRPGK
jgi:hypothetical protein